MHENSLNNLKVLSSNEARFLGKLGGEKSGQKRRELKEIRNYAKVLMNTDITDEKSIQILQKYLPDTSKDEYNVILLSLALLMNELTSESIKPSERIKILTFLRDSLGQKPQERIVIDEVKEEEYRIDKFLDENFTTEELVEMVKNMYLNEKSKGENYNG